MNAKSTHSDYGRKGGRARTAAKIAAAKANGAKGGRPRKPPVTGKETKL